LNQRNLQLLEAQTRFVDERSDDDHKDDDHNDEGGPVRNKEKKKKRLVDHGQGLLDSLRGALMDAEVSVIKCDTTGESCTTRSSEGCSWTRR
jgi:hypothetical protein